MRVSVFAPQGAPGLAADATGRIQKALDRYGASIRGVVVRVRDENGPRGGNDQSCLLRISLRGAPDVTVRERGTHPLGVILTALKRARRRVAERLNARSRRQIRSVESRRQIALSSPSSDD
ncbi:hypothetical protein [Botrimarina hoheduenensis]|uniref:Sigma 54 modulation protein / S30EA ribosomal protein n=1 Tax=Botrimarina hoheduenensis TaxID=2528000 RepID=A0A5C5VWK2_9BACT|nr:hypothetical protein [Botrimarina hoheduenensis]TWT42487.1 hypothetical protein Pla111_27920 [Botrimarina hoheduenensis]